MAAAAAGGYVPLVHQAQLFQVLQRRSIARVVSYDLLKMLNGSIKLRDKGRRGSGVSFDEGDSEL